MKDHKKEKERTRSTMGGGQIEYPRDKSTRRGTHNSKDYHQQQHLNKGGGVLGQ
jgi:hypothetical protein